MAKKKKNLRYAELVAQQRAKLAEAKRLRAKSERVLARMKAIARRIHDGLERDHAR